jgi:hypothetical protein
MSDTPHEPGREPQAPDGDTLARDEARKIAHETVDAFFGSFYQGEPEFRFHAEWSVNVPFPCLLVYVQHGTFRPPTTMWVDWEEIGGVDG